MERKRKHRNGLSSFVNYNWRESFNNNKDLIADEYVALTFNGAFIMTVVLIIGIIYNLSVGFTPIIKYYIAALPVLLLFMAYSYYSLYYHTSYLASAVITHLFAISVFLYSICVHMIVDDFGQQNLIILFIYITLFPILLVHTPVQKLVFVGLLAGITWGLIYGEFFSFELGYVLFSDLLTVTATSYLFGIYMTWVKLRGYERIKKEDYISRHDEATGLRNRRNFFLDFDRYEKEGGVSGVIVIDINDFKNINDTYGHVIGDNAIVHVANILTSMGEEHLIHFYRYGGDEFVGLVSKNCTCNPDVVAKNVQKQVSDLPFCSVGNGEIYVTISVGTAEKREGESSEQVIARADKEMYEDKQRMKALNHTDQTV